MMLPSVFGENLFDTWFDAPLEREFFGSRNPLYGKHEKQLMKTDVRETPDGYELDVDLPGFKKDEITLRLENGYLMIGASKSLDKTEEKKDSSYIRRERYVGGCTRSFYVGEGVTRSEVHARMEDGILHLTFPKKDQKKLEENKYIAIEG